jgi:hypothetical protein
MGNGCSASQHDEEGYFIRSRNAEGDREIMKNCINISNNDRNVHGLSEAVERLLKILSAEVSSCGLGMTFLNISKTNLNRLYIRCI